MQIKARLTRVIGKLERIAKRQILIIVKHFVGVKIADRNRRYDSNFVNTGAALLVEQDTGKSEISDRPFDDRVGTLA